MKYRLNQDLDISVGDDCLLLFHKVKHVRQPDLNKPKIKKLLWNKEKQLINNPNLTQLKVNLQGSTASSLKRTFKKILIAKGLLS